MILTIVFCVCRIHFHCPMVAPAVTFLPLQYLPLVTLDEIIKVKKSAIVHPLLVHFCGD